MTLADVTDNLGSIFRECPRVRKWKETEENGRFGKIEHDGHEVNDGAKNTSERILFNERGGGSMALRSHPSRSRRRGSELSFNSPIHRSRNPTRFVLLAPVRGGEDPGEGPELRLASPKGRITVRSR